MKVKKILVFILLSLSLFGNAQTEQVEYPLYPYGKDLSQTLTFKIMLRCARPEDISNLDMFKVLTYIQQIDVITRGMPKVVILGGFQQDGHDHQYPWWTPINDTFVAPGNRTGKAALTWLVNMAKRYNTYCTFHVNPFDAYEDSPKWDEYIEKDLICRSLTGNLVKGDIWWDRQSYMVNLTKEWEDGVTQKKIDEFIEEMPIVQETGVLYFDNITQYPASSYHGITSADQIETIKKCALYLKEKYNVQLVAEYGDPKLYGYLSLGVTWDWFASLQVNQMEIPAYLMCGGRDIAHDDLLGQRVNLKPQLQVFGTSLQLEDIQFQFYPDRVLREFTHHTLTYFYLNRLLRQNYQQIGGKLELTLSDNVVSKFENNIHTLHKDGNLMKEGYDVFIPVYWVNHPEIMTYSLYGCNRTWSFPENWENVSNVDIYTFNSDFDALVLEEQNKPITSNSITINNPPNKGYIIVPSGTDMNTVNSIYTQPESGKVEFLEADIQTSGDWKNTYGKKGYDVFGATPNIPENAEVSYVGDELNILSAESIHPNALENPDNNFRIEAKRSSELHQIIDVNIREGEKEKVSLYFADYENKKVQILVDVIDVVTKKVLDSKIVNDFANGVYLSYNIEGHVQFRLTRFFDYKYQTVGKPSCSGIFFDKAGGSSIGENQIENEKIKCYPNPFSYESRIYLPQINDQTVNLRIYSLSGQLMFDKTHRVANEPFITISPKDVGDTEGIYLFYLSTKQKEYQGKIIYKK